MTFRGRFAPSPTGRLHLGNARTALLGWLQARSVGGEFLLRVEDLDPDRAKPEHEAACLEDLAWLGLDWDGPVWRQRERAQAYRAALETLRQAGRLYPCTCSRAEVARAASAPHAGEDGPTYPGTCLREGPKADRKAALRFRAEGGPTTFVDLVRGPFTQDVAQAVGDFVVQRQDGVASYQLAVVVDDAAQGVSCVLRGDDLLDSTPRQLQLYRALGLSAPAFAHVPLLLGADGRRLAKREGLWTLGGLRQAGARPEALVGLLAHSAGLGDGRPVHPRALLPGFSLRALRRDAAPLPEETLRALVGAAP